MIKILKQNNGDLMLPCQGTNSGDAPSTHGEGTYRYVSYATTYDANGNPNYPDL